MTKPLMLEGLIQSPQDDSEGLLQEWRREKQQFEEEILRLRHELDEANAQNEKLERSIRGLRQQLSPLHRALRAVFGEIELAIGEEMRAASEAPNLSPANSGDPRWESFKRTFSGCGAEIIDALLAHQQMTLSQLSTLLKRHYDTVKGAAAKLQKAGAVVRDGTMLRLNR